MKLKTTLLVGLMSLTLLSCGGSSTKSEWNEAELALIQEHLYNVELPYYYIEGNGELTYNENFDGLVLSGASVTSSELDAYASKFDLDVWTMGLSFEKDMIYAFTQEVETEDDVIYLTQNYITRLKDENRENQKTLEKLDKFLAKFDVKKFMKQNPNMTSADFHMIMYNETAGLL